MGTDEERLAAAVAAATAVAVREAIENAEATYVRKDVHDQTHSALETRVRRIEAVMSWIAATIGVSLIGAVMALLLKASG